jgi:biopolymer transport protein ExbD
MGRGRRHREQPRAEINITNLVDVTMTLLVVFMIVAPMLKQGLEIELPKSRVADNIKSEDKVILVECDQTQSIQINHNGVVLSSVEQTIRDLRQQYGEVPVQVRADEKLPYGFIVGIWGEIRAAGVDSIGVELVKIKIGS